MRLPRMIKFAALATIVVLTISRDAYGATSTDRNLLERSTQSTELADEAIRNVFRKIASGESTPSDDDELFNLIRDEIIRTAYKIKTPAGSIEAAAHRAQKLVSELTSAYTTAIYKSKSTEDARRNFARFQRTVQRIVDFTKSGKFVTA